MPPVLHKLPVASSLRRYVVFRRCNGVAITRRLQDLTPKGGVFKLNKKLESWWLLDFPELQSEIRKAFKGSISLTERNAWQDYFEQEQKARQKLQIELMQLEQQLNIEVYKLFVLNDKEIALIEA